MRRTPAFIQLLLFGAVTLPAITGCRGSTDPTVGEPSLDVAAVGPSTCLPADVVVASADDLWAELQTPNRRIAIDGVIAFASPSAVATDGITLTCTSPGVSALELTGQLHFSGAGLTLHGLIVEQKYNGLYSLMASGPAATIAYNTLRASAAVYRDALVTHNAMVATGPYTIQLAVIAGADARVLANDFFSGGGTLAQLFVANGGPVEIANNRFTSVVTPSFSAVQIQTPRARVIMSGNTISSMYAAFGAFPFNRAVYVSGTSPVELTDNIIRGPWNMSLYSIACDVRSIGTGLDGGDIVADVFLNVSSCRNYVRTKLAVPEAGVGERGPQFTVIDLGTDNTILGTSLIKIGTYAAPTAFADNLHAFCPPGQECS